MNGDQDQAADPLEVIGRHCRAIMLALTAVDLARPDCEPITRQARAGIEVVLVAVSEIRNYRPIR